MPIRDKISVVTIAKNEENRIEIFLNKISWVDEIIIVDNNSSDKTTEIAKKFTNKIYLNKERNLGLLKQFGLYKVNTNWAFLLDVDELVTDSLKREIQNILFKGSKYDAYLIPYQNYFLNHKLVCRAQLYSKTRLFKLGMGFITPDFIHEEVKVVGTVGKLKGKIQHYSFRSIRQTLSKFNKYAEVEAPLLIASNHQTSFRKLTLYPLHMFWSIFVEGEGWRDGIWGFGLALCFAYYEFARYVFLWKHSWKRR